MSTLLTCVCPTCGSPAEVFWCTSFGQSPSGRVQIVHAECAVDRDHWFHGPTEMLLGWSA